MRPGQQHMRRPHGTGNGPWIRPRIPLPVHEKRRDKGRHIIAIGTDGIWETGNRKGEMFGRERFRQLLQAHAHLPAAELINTILTELEAFRVGRKSEDNLTLVIITIKRP